MHNRRHNRKPNCIYLQDGFVTLATNALEQISSSRDSNIWKTKIASIRLFNKFFGDLPVDQIERSHGEKFVVFLQHTPARRKKSRDAISYLGSISGGVDSDNKAFSFKTIDQHLYSLAWLWNVVKGNNPSLSDNNPFRNHFLPKSRTKTNKGLSQREIEQIFSVPVFTSRERPVSGLGEFCFWLPLLLLFTGGSPEEIANLRIEDFKRGGQSEDATIVFMGSLAERGTHENLYPSREKRPGYRILPVPLNLIEIGLFDYIAWLDNHNEKMLFPQLHSKRTIKEQIARFSHWWSAYLCEHGVRLHNIRPMRAFQQTWLIEARRCGVELEAQQYSTGKLQSENIYSEQILANFRRELSKVSFRGYDLSRIQYWTF